MSFALRPFYPGDLGQVLIGQELVWNADKKRAFRENRAPVSHHFTDKIFRLPSLVSYVMSNVVFAANVKNVLFFGLHTFLYISEYKPNI